MRFSTTVFSVNGVAVRASVGFDLEGAEASFAKQGRAYLQVGIRFEQVVRGAATLKVFVPASEWPAVEARAAAGTDVYVGPERLRLRSEDVLGELRSIAAVAKSVHVEGQRGCLVDVGAQAVRS
jgi:hypothetical protein